MSEKNKSKSKNNIDSNRPEAEPEVDGPTKITISDLEEAILEEQRRIDHEEYALHHPVLDAEGNVTPEYITLANQLAAEYEVLINQLIKDAELLESEGGSEEGGGCTYDQSSTATATDPVSTTTTIEADRNSNNFLINSIAKVPPSLEWLKILSGNSDASFATDDLELEAYNDLYDFDASVYDPASIASALYATIDPDTDDDDDDIY